MNKQHDLATAKAEDVSGLTLSSSHLVKLGVLAMIGTGIFAALDVGHGRTDFGQTAPSAARVESEGSVITISEPEPQRFSKAETRSLAEPAADASSTSSLSAAPRSVPPSGTTPAPETSTLSVQAANVLGRPGATTLEPEAPVKEEAQTASASATTLPSNVARDATRATAGVRRDCDLSELNAVLADVTARFGRVTVVAGHQSKMVNHMSGSPREKLHGRLIHEPLSSMPNRQSTSLRVQPA